MSKKVRSGYLCTLIVAVFLLFALWLGGWAGGPAALVRALQTGEPPSAPAQAPAVSSLYVLQTFFGSIQSGDGAAVAALTGGTGSTPGIPGWGSVDLQSFPGNTQFGPLGYQLTADNGKEVVYRVQGGFYFQDPGGPPGQGSRDHYYIDGEARLTAKGNSWIVTALPNYGMTGYTYSVVATGRPHTTVFYQAAAGLSYIGAR